MGDEERSSGRSFILQNNVNAGLKCRFSGLLF